MMASLSRARSWSVAMRNGGDGLGPDVYLRCTYRVPRIDLRPASRPVDPPAASGSRRSEAASTVLAPYRVLYSRQVRPIMAVMERTVTLTANLTSEEGGYVARCVELPVTTEGDTVEEALAALREAVELYLEDEPPVALPGHPLLALFDVTVAA
jgi:predicted RNase H-like HicB family nuclease